jgi:predicted amidohydrolase
VKLVLLKPQLHHAPEADNVGTIRRLLSDATPSLDPEDIVLLPERFDIGDSRERYEHDLVCLARDLGCYVVGGSHHEPAQGGLVNSGLLLDARGQVCGRYEKLRPYATERAFVHPGRVLGELEIAGRRALVLICADFWFSDLFQRAAHLPDMVLVPALSVTRKATPEYSRTLWRHLAVARAYEFGTYIGISDWAHPSELPLLSASGVSGFADPTVVEPDALFSAVGPSGVGVYDLDFERLAAFRRDRVERGFFWKQP